MNQGSVFFNGLDGATGEYSDPPSTVDDLVATLRRGPVRHVGTRRAAEAGVDPHDLASAGWGVIFPDGVDPATRKALEPLLDRRREQATRHDERLYRELVHWPGETKRRFLPRNGAGPGPVHPPTMPYFLMIVGGPEEIPFDFQLELEVQYAVGRVSFDRVSDYARYAEKVVAQEMEGTRRSRSAEFFGVRNENDPATEASEKHLVRPLLARLRDRHPRWKIEGVLAERATRARLISSLNGPETPALLFTAGHAVLFPAAHPRQRGEQGALVCYDWPGPGLWHGPILRDHLVSALDLEDDAPVDGMVAFQFACCSAGTPTTDAFARDTVRESRGLAEQAFVARFPQQLLVKGALAVIGHVERAWPHSFIWDRAGSQVGVFASTISKILEGYPVGYAMEDFGIRYAEIATELLTSRLTLDRSGDEASAEDVAQEAWLWTAYQDARHYLLLGDPAVRLRTKRP